MLGFAFSEAQRSQELMKRIHQGKTGQPGSVVPPQTTFSVSSSSSVPTAEGGASVASGSSVTTGSSGGGGGHRRTRRRRRTRKHSSSTNGGGSASGIGSVPVSHRQGPPKHVQVNGGPGGGGGSLPRKSSGGRASSSNQMHAGNARAKQHDPPMRKRDLYLSLRCGMVSTNVATLGTDSAVGRVTIVNWDNQIVLDAFVKVPPQDVTDYRTEHTGITAELLAMSSALRFDSARSKVMHLIRGKILIGHGLEVDLGALGLSHPWCDIRDNATYAPYMKQVNDPLTVMMLPRSIDELMYFIFNRGVNLDQPTLVREAIGCLDLYKHSRDRWEKELIQVIQAKEKQRDMVMKMRSSGSQTLSSINEKNALIPSSALVGSISSSGHHVRCDEYDYDDSTLASSTLASTEPTTATVNSPYLEDYSGQPDNVSEASSYFTHDAEAETSSFFRLRQQHGLKETVPSHIENLSDLGGLRISDTTTADSNNAVNSNTAPGSQFNNDNWSSGIPSASGGIDQAPALWSPIVQPAGNNSVASADWSHESPHSSVNSMKFGAVEEEKAEITAPAEATSLMAQNQVALPVSLATQLLADVDEQEGESGISKWNQESVRPPPGFSS